MDCRGEEDKNKHAFIKIEMRHPKYGKQDYWKCVHCGAEHKDNDKIIYH